MVKLEKEILQHLGYRVTSRTGSVEALAAFTAMPDRYDLVITDNTMPNMTGIDLTRELKKIKPGIRIIICSGFSEKIDQNELDTLGVNDFVFKPIIKSKIAKKIRKVLDGC